MIDVNIPIEVTLDHAGVETHTYRPTLGQRSVEGGVIEGLLFSLYPEVLLPPFPPKEQWELYDHSKCNGINYLEDMITVTYRTKDITPLLDHLCIDLPDAFESVGLYCLKFSVPTPRITLKVYDRNISRHNPPALPAGVIPEDEYGIGYHLNNQHIAHLRDVYFYTELDAPALASFFKVPVPDDRTRGPGRRAFSCLYDIKTSTPIVLKQYSSPHLADFEGY